MRKRFLSIVLAMCMMLALPSITVSAEDNDFTIVDGVLTKYNGNGGAVTIPDSVIEIDRGAFYYCTGLTSVTIPNSVKTIGIVAFRGCSNLTSVTIGTGVTLIGIEAFFGCTSLTSITIPDSVDEIESGAFYGCTSLSTVNVDSDNQNYSSVDGVLFNKTQTLLHTYPAGKDGMYSIPNGVTSIGDKAFSECTGLTSIAIPSSVAEIGWSAFSECTGLTDITIPESVTKLGIGVFYGCSGLTSITIPDSVVEIGYAAFEGCKGLTSVTIGKGVTFIDCYMFCRCTGLSSVAIPDSVTEISWDVFDGCTGLTSITIPDSVISIGAGAFLNCDRLTNVYYSGTQSQWNKITVDVTNDWLTSATIHYAAADVTYSANGGSGTMAADVATKNTPYTLPACGFTAPTGKGFKAWSINGVEYAPGDVCTVTVDTTVTAVWKDASTACTLSGTITGHQGVAYASVTVKLVGLDGTEYSATVTGDESLDGTTKKECTYSVSAPAGQYNLLVEATAASGTTVNRTALVKLSGDQTKNVNLPNGQAKSNITVNTSAAEVIAGNLDSLIVSDDGSLIAGTSAEVTLTVDDVDTSTTEAVSIQNAASGQTLEFVEFSIRKTVDGTTTDVSDTGDTPIEIVLSFENAGKRNVKVYRYHDGRVDTLTEQAVNGEKIEVTGNSITICAKKFSVYAIGYDSAPENQTPVSGSSSSSNSGSGSLGPSYNITVPNLITGGKVEVSTGSAKRGDAVTVIATPDEGYMTATVAATDASGNMLTLTDKGNGKYTFTMPASNVGLNVTFAKLDNGDSSVTNPFTDVSEGAYYYDAVLWAVGNGITTGTSATTFGPNAACTRAQIVAFLWRAAGSPAPESGDNPFTDVPVGAYYYDAVLWAVEQGIANGTDIATFSPDAVCTRAQAVTFLWRAAEAPCVSSGSGFSDVADSAYYANAVKWAVANGVTNGTGGATFSPDADCTRGQIVTFLYRDRVN